MALVRSSVIGIVGLDEVVANAQVRTDVKDKFGSLLSLYEQYLDLPVLNALFNVELHKSSWLDEHVNEIYSIPDLNLFLQNSRVFEHHPHYNTNEGRTGIFLTKLMQNAYNDGTSNFVLDMNGLQPLHRVGQYLKQNPRR